MLVVVDVQKRFSPSKSLVTEVVRQIKKANRNHELVTLLHYWKGPSVKAVQDAVRGTKHLVVSKTNDDGGGDIFKSLCMLNGDFAKSLKVSNIKSMKVCGINTSACVMATVRSLSYLKFPVKVIASACENGFDFSDDYNTKHHVGAIKRMKKWKNVEII